MNRRAIYSRSVDGLLAEDAPELQEMEQIEVYTSTRDGPVVKQPPHLCDRLKESLFWMP